MKKELEVLYQIEIEFIIKNSEKTYKIQTNNGIFILKEHDNQSLENIYMRIRMMHLDCFVLPKKSKNERYIEQINGKYYSLSEYFKDEDLLAKDLRLSFFIKCLASLHQDSSYPLRVNDGLFEESISFLDNRISLVKDELISRIERVEHSDYHSPSDWYFLMNYYVIFNSLKEADRYVSLLEDEWKENKNIHLSLTYQNFNYNHIIVKQYKIISLDKMALAPSIYDLVDLFDKIYEEKIDVSFIMDQYLAIHKLEKYEEYWLLAFLFIPRINRSDNDLIDIENLYKCLNFISLSSEIASKFSQETPE